MAKNDPKAQALKTIEKLRIALAKVEEAIQDGKYTMADKRFAKLDDQIVTFGDQISDLQSIE